MITGKSYGSRGVFFRPILSLSSKLMVSKRLECKQVRERDTLQKLLRSMMMGIARRVQHFQRLRE